MLTKRSLSALTLAERQALRWQWLRSGRCVRCFRTSLRRTAEGDSAGANDQGIPFNGT